MTYEPKLGERLVETTVSINVTTKVWSDFGISNEKIEEGIAAELPAFVDKFIAPPVSDEHPYLISRDLSTSVIVKDV